MISNLEPVVNEVKKRTLILPFAGERGCTLVQLLKTYLQQTLPSNVKADNVYTDTIIASNFNIKDQTPFEEKHDLLYRSVCGTDNCTEDYIGETGRRVIERVKDHNGRDHHSHLVKHVVEANHIPVTTNNFTILNSGYRNNKRKRKIAEALMIKELRPSLNIQEKSVQLHLFN